MVGSRDLLCTIAIGEEAKALARYSVPLMRSYAARIECDFQILGPSEYSYNYRFPYFEKLQLGQLLNDYDRVLYIDCDIIILPSAGNIFECVPASDLGVTVVGYRLRGVQNEAESINAFWRFTIDQSKYWNAGVILASKPHQSIFLVEHDAVSEWSRLLATGEVKALHDQTLFNYLAQRNGIRVKDLGKDWNRTRSWGAFHSRFQSNFIHYAGMTGNRERLMRLDSRLAQARMLHLMRRYQRLSWIRDKLIDVTN